MTEITSKLSTALADRRLGEGPTGRDSMDDRCVVCRSELVTVPTPAKTFLLTDKRKRAMLSFRWPKGVHVTRSKSDVLLGTLDLLVLKLLECGPNHGWGLAEQLEEVTDGVFAVNQGSLYPALQRLKRKGFVRAKWGVTENGRRARYYQLTSGGGGYLQ